VQTLSAQLEQVNCLTRIFPTLSGKFIDRFYTTKKSRLFVIAYFEKGKNYYPSNPEQDVKILTQLSGLNEAELKKLLTLLAG
jgi:hypothetical protein